MNAREQWAADRIFEIDGRIDAIKEEVRQLRCGVVVGRCACVQWPPKSPHYFAGAKPEIVACGAVGPQCQRCGRHYDVALTPVERRKEVRP